MTGMTLFRAMEGLDEKWVLDAAPDAARKVLRPWMKWAAAAACLCLLAAAAGLAVMGRLKPRSEGLQPAAPA